MPGILLLVCLEIAFLQLTFLCNAFEIKIGPIQAASVQNKLIPVAITNQCKQVEAKATCLEDKLLPVYIRCVNFLEIRYDLT
jgi:hypothetical protein